MCNNLNVCPAAAKIGWGDKGKGSWKLREPEAIFKPHPVDILMSNCHFVGFDSFLVKQTKIKCGKRRKGRRTNALHTQAKTKDSLLIGKFYAIIKLFSLFSGILLYYFFVFCFFVVAAVSCCWYFVALCIQFCFKLQMEMKTSEIPRIPGMARQGGRSNPLETVTETESNSCVTKVKMEMHIRRCDGGGIVERIFVMWQQKRDKMSLPAGHPWTTCRMSVLC